MDLILYSQVIPKNLKIGDTASILCAQQQKEYHSEEKKPAGLLVLLLEICLKRFFYLDVAESGISRLLVDCQ